MLTATTKNNNNNTRKHMSSKCLSCHLAAPSNSHRIVLNFTFMDTECTYDYLFVYDGDSYQSPLLASLSGKTLPQPIEAKSGKVGRIVMLRNK